METSPKLKADLDRVLAQISGGRPDSLQWLRQPLKAFQDVTPEDLMSSGRADDVIGFLRSISSGFVG